MKSRYITILLCLLIGTYLTATATAVELSISNATATQFSDQFPPNKAFDGLTNESEPGPGPHTDTYWLSENGVLSDTITFDLDTSGAPNGYQVTQVDIVNTSNSGWNDRETDEFGLEVFDSLASNWIEIVPNGTPIEVYWPDTKTIDVSGVSNITQVRVSVTNDPAVGPVGGDDAGTGLNEVKIFGVVPEPTSTILISTAGLLLFWIGRKRLK